MVRQPAPKSATAVSVVGHINLQMDTHIPQCGHKKVALTDTTIWIAKFAVNDLKSMNTYLTLKKRTTPNNMASTLDTTRKKN